MRPIIFLLISLLYLASCQDKASNKYSSNKLLCGSEAPLAQGFLHFKSSNGTPLSPSDLEVFAATPSGLQNKTKSLSSRGCLPLSSLSEAKKVLIRSASKEVKILDIDKPLQGAMAVTLQKPKPLKDIRGCKLKYLKPGIYSPKHFIHIDLLEEKSFYEVSANLKTIDPSKVLSSFPRAPLENSQFSIQEKELNFQLDMTLTDYIRNTNHPISCKITTKDPGHSVTPFKNSPLSVDYFGRDYTLVEKKDGSFLDFDIKGDLENVEIEYCLSKISLDDVSLGNKSELSPKECLKEDIKYWRADRAAERLQEGFYQLNYRSSKDTWQVDWQTKLILMERVCEGDFDHENLAKASGCTTIEGGLRLTSDTLFQSLTHLRFVSKITGSTKISATSFSNLDFLRNLTFANKIEVSKNKKLETLHLNLKSIDNHFDIIKNDILKSISVKKVEEIGNGLRFQYNPMLTSLDFPSLKTIKGKFVLEQCHKLTEISGFSALEHIDKKLEIVNNQALTHLFTPNAHFQSLPNGILIKENQNLAQIDFKDTLRVIGPIDIHDNDSLESIKGFSEVDFFWRLRIFNNKNLVDVESFDKVSEVNSDIILSNNPKLTSISFPSLTIINGQLNIKLSQLESLQIDNLKTIIGLYYIKANTKDCIEPYDIETIKNELCTTLPSKWSTKNKAYIEEYQKGFASNNGCPPNYVLVPESLEYNLKAFCVMAYEAKRDNDNAAISNASYLPWTDIWRGDAQDACRKNGENYDLISNSQWQVIARLIEKESSNFIFPDLKAGPIMDEAFAIFDMEKAKEVRSHCLFGCQDGDKDRIYDMAGNVWELTLTDNSQSQDFNGYPHKMEDSFVKRKFGPKNVYDGMVKGFGVVDLGNDPGMVARGGYFGMDENTAGIFAALVMDFGRKSEEIGFRCVTEPLAPKRRPLLPGGRRWLDLDLPRGRPN